MKSERAKQFIDNDAIIMNNGDRMVDASTAYTAIEIAEQEAEERIREELTRWHDPEKELPGNNACVLCKVNECEVSQYLVLNYYEGRWWACHPYEVNDDCSEDSWRLFGGTVIGWREIHE